MEAPLFWYFIEDLGDGSCGIRSFASKEECEEACAKDEYEGFLSDGVQAFYESDIKK